MMKKSRVVTIGVILGIPTLLVVAFGAIFVVWPQIIKKRVYSFCDSIEIGSPHDVAVTKAHALSLQVWLFPARSIDKRDPQAEIRGWDGVLFNRYFFTIRTLDGKVTSKRMLYID